MILFKYCTTLIQDFCITDIELSFLFLTCKYLISWILVHLVLVLPHHLVDTSCVLICSTLIIIFISEGSLIPCALIVHASDTRFCCLLICLKQVQMLALSQKLASFIAAIWSLHLVALWDSLEIIILL